MITYVLYDSAILSIALPNKESQNPIEDGVSLYDERISLL